MTRGHIRVVRVARVRDLLVRLKAFLVLALSEQRAAEQVYKTSRAERIQVHGLLHPLHPLGVTGGRWRKPVPHYEAPNRQDRHAEEEAVPVTPIAAAMMHAQGDQQ